MPQQKHIHLIGICGTAMASLAGMLQSRGYRVTGSDAAAYPPMSDLLRSMGIAVAGSYTEANLVPHPSLVIVGNAISRGNPELEYLLNQRIPFDSMAATIHHEFLADRESIVVAGTHGKTTTTSMLAWIFEVAARKQKEFSPSFLIGGVAENFGTSFCVRERGPFILEGDEYDTAFFDKGPKFMHYFPQAMILTHVEFDHADIYRDLDAVKTAFSRLVNLVPSSGRIVAFDGSGNVDECVRRAFCRVERYGFKASSDWMIQNLSQNKAGSHWKIQRAGEQWLEVQMPMPGEHNALNATAAAALASGQGIYESAILEALASFHSVKRRLEVRAVVDDVTIIDDFAHHPTAIRETLKSLRASYPGQRLWAVLEPRSNTLRRNVFEKELVQSLSLADKIVMAGVYQQEKIAEAERMNPQHVISALVGSGSQASLYPTADAIVEAVAPQLEAGDVVAILSNGGFDGIYEKLPQALRERSGKKSSK
jgi:UDP-N-acetylmuramate: L-alanyl-gamma-D-glutamyl-meso-diaminopimelate ligase